MSLLQGNAIGFDIGNPSVTGMRLELTFVPTASLAGEPKALAPGQGHFIAPNLESGTRREPMRSPRDHHIGPVTNIGFYKCDGSVSWGQWGLPGAHSLTKIKHIAKVNSRL